MFAGKKKSTTFAPLFTPRTCDGKLESKTSNFE